MTAAVPPITDVLMAAALFGLGTGIDVRRLLSGGRALLLGGIATGLIGGISLVGAVLLIFEWTLPPRRNVLILEDGPGIHRSKGE